MKVSVSFLSIKDNLEQKLLELSKTDVDYIHLDIMDGIFVNNKTWNSSELDFLKKLNKPLDIHLMVNDIYKYIASFISFKPAFITFHYEASSNPIEIINYLNELGINVGISINPGTNIEVLTPYLDKVDLVLLMSVNPGFGGQKFIKETINKIEALREFRENNEYHYLIEVDGGINNNNIKDINSDIVVVGSFITNSETYQNKIDELR